MKVAIYLRSARQDQPSFEAQRQRCLAYAAQEGHDVTSIYEDVGRSGMDNHRPGVQAMFEAAKTGAFDGLIIDHVSRLSRNWYLADCMDALEQNNVTLFVVDGLPQPSPEQRQQWRAEFLKMIQSDAEDTSDAHGGGLTTSQA